MPCLTSNILDKYHVIVSGFLWYDRLMFIVGEKKARIARLNGKVNYDRISCITIIADGSWSRSYKNHYSSLLPWLLVYWSLKEILFSFCHWVSPIQVVTCDYKCFKNLYGLTTQMKSNIIVESFHCTIEMLGIK